jgi:hypothetical protein
MPEHRSLQKTCSRWHRAARRFFVVGCLALMACGESENCLDLETNDRLEATVVLPSQPPRACGDVLDINLGTVLVATVREFPGELRSGRDCMWPCSGGCVFGESDFEPVGRWTWTRVGTPTLIHGPVGGRYVAESTDGCRGSLEAIIGAGRLPVRSVDLEVDYRRDPSSAPGCPVACYMVAKVDVRRL